MEEFLKEANKYNIFSYEDYLISGIHYKIAKIKLLNDYLKLKYKDKNINKLPVYIDFDGVIFDTYGYVRKEVLDKYGVDIYTHSRTNIEEEKLIHQYFCSLNWQTLLATGSTLNASKVFLDLIKDNILYDPTIYTAVNNNYEKEEKIKYFDKTFKNIPYKFMEERKPKTVIKENSVLIDDDDYNLEYWQFYPIHFNSKINSIFPSIDNLGELFYLFNYNENKNLIEPKYLYKDLELKLDKNNKKLKWQKK